MTEKFEIGKSMTQIIKFAESRQIIELTPPYEPEGETQIGDLYSGCEFYDDVNGAKRNFKLAVKARKLEICFFRS